MGLYVAARRILDPSGSLFPKQLSMMRFFSSSNFSARLMEVATEAALPLRISGVGLAPGPMEDPLGGPRTRLKGSLAFMVEWVGGKWRVLESMGTVFCFLHLRPPCHLSAAVLSGSSHIEGG